jgi:cell division initiation protein
MKITPLEIRQKTFEKAFRGLDKDEVDAFLTTMSSEWEKLQDENKALRIRLESSEKEVEKLREVENSLFKTLKTAEDTGANMIDQATRTAQLHMRETEMNAEAIMNDAKSKAKDMIEEAEMRSRNAIEDMEDRLRSMAQLYRTLENVREDLLSDIKSFTTDAMEKVNRVKAQITKVNIDEELMKIKRENSSKRAHQPEMELKTKEGNVKTQAPEKEVVEEQAVEPVERVTEESKGSFFDDLE